MNKNTNKSQAGKANPVIINIDSKASSEPATPVAENESITLHIAEEAPAPKKSLAELVQYYNKMQSRIHKRNTYLATKEKLEEFKHDNEKDGEPNYELVLRNSNRNTFNTSNSLIIGSMLDYLIEVCEKLTAQAEDEIIYN